MNPYVICRLDLDKWIYEPPSESEDEFKSNDLTFVMGSGGDHHTPMTNGGVRSKKGKKRKGKRGAEDEDDEDEEMEKVKSVLKHSDTKHGIIRDID